MIFMTNSLDFSVIVCDPGLLALSGLYIVVSIVILKDKQVFYFSVIMYTIYLFVI